MGVVPPPFWTDCPSIEDDHVTMPSALESTGSADSSIGGYIFRSPTTRPSRPAQPSRPDEARVVFDDPDQLADLAAAQRGNREALERLLSRHTDRLFAVCIRMAGRADAEDLLQESLVRIIKALPQFRGESRVSTWMLRIAVNTCLTCHRKRKSRPSVSLEAAGGAQEFSKKDGEPGAVAAVETRERIDRLEQVFSELEPHQRVIITLRDLQGLDYQEIAAVLGVPLGTVKSRLFRARLALREGVEGKRRSGSGSAD
ncbi:MAG: RNA polymerase sigma factor [Phycisphaerales bacterium]|nr:RNA polymerase sigma factor [Phycisphaerales bacterium]